MDIKENVKVISFKIFLTFFTLCTLLWLSIFSYGIMYYIYIPAVAHIKQVHLRYDMSCYGEKYCKYPYDNITLIELGNEFLRGGQGYAIELSLNMPESERNLNQGMFMIKLDMTELNGNVIKSSFRPAMLRYRSPLFKIIYTLFFIPGLLAGSIEERQSLVVPLFDTFIEDSRHPAHYAYIEVQAQWLEVYSSTLRVHAQFTGLRYLMYYWPVTSAVIGVVSNFLFLVVTMALIWLRETMKETTDEEPSNEFLQSVRQEIQSKSKKKPILKSGVSLGISREKSPERRSDTPSGFKRERIEPETLSRHLGIEKSQPTGFRSYLRDDESNDEEFFDPEQISTPKTESVAQIPENLELSVMEQRFKGIRE